MVVAVFVSTGASAGAAGSAGLAAASGVQVALSVPSFGSSVMRRSFAVGLGVVPSAVTANAPAASTGASGGRSTGRPATNIASNFDSVSNGSPLATIRLASLPFSRVPVRPSMPRIRAGVVVSAASASSRVRPWVMASARRLRKEPLSCMRCVVSATVVPAAMKRFGLVGA